MLTAKSAEALADATPSGAIELISNGGFETGTFDGWTVTNRAGSDGNWYIDNADGYMPNDIYTTRGPASGAFYAVTDMLAPGTHALEQTINVLGPAASVLLSFDMFVLNTTGAGPIVDPIGLNHVGPPNQHARVDLLTSDADSFDTAADVLANFYIGADQLVFNQPYVPYDIDITSLVGMGGTYKLRFATVHNQHFIFQAVDNVSVLYTPVPEPAALVLAVTFLAAMNGKCCRPLARRMQRRFGGTRPPRWCRPCRRCSRKESLAEVQRRGGRRRGERLRRVGCAQPGETSTCSAIHFGRFG